jgi:hypothetical protein
LYFNKIKERRYMNEIQWFNLYLVRKALEYYKGVLKEEKLKHYINCPECENQGRTPLTGGRKSGGVEKREHRSVICDYENNNRADGCVAGILPEPGLHGKRENRRRQYREPWQETPALSVQDLWEDLQRAGRHDV